MPAKTAAPAHPETLHQLKQLLVEELDINLKIEQLADDVALLEEGLALDSVLIAELITLIENRFGFQFDDQDMNTDTFRDLTTLANFIASRKQVA